MRYILIQIFTFLIYFPTNSFGQSDSITVFIKAKPTAIQILQINEQGIKYEKDLIVSFNLIDSIHVRNIEITKRLSNYLLNPEIHHYTDHYTILKTNSKYIIKQNTEHAPIIYAGSNGLFLFPRPSLILSMDFYYNKDMLATTNQKDTSKFQIPLFFQIHFTKNPNNGKFDIGYNIFQNTFYFAMLFTEVGPNKLNNARFDFLFLLLGGRCFVPITDNSNFFFGNSFDTFFFNRNNYAINRLTMGFDFHGNNYHFRIPLEYTSYIKVNNPDKIFRIGFEVFYKERGW